MIENYKIKIGGLERYITSYEQLLLTEPGSITIGSEPLTTFQYLSCLFNNLGYDKCPKDFLWLENNIDIELVEKTEVLDYPITKNPLMIFKDCDLFTLLICIRNWIKSDIERGHILDPRKSFKLPAQRDIEFYQQNRVKLMRTAVIDQKIKSWNKADIIWRRLYNLNPNIDSEYFEYHIPNFEFWSKYIRIENARPLFISVLVDPDILLSVIKQSEIEATVRVHSMDNKPIVLLNEQKLVGEFYKIFSKKVQQIMNIYRNKGIRGFITDQYKIVKKDVSNIPSMNVNLITPIYMGQNRQVDQSIFGEIFYQIASIPITGDTIAYIMKYIDNNSMKFIERMDQYDIQRIATYKRLYYTIEQLKSSNPELLNPKDRFMLSEPFYIDSDTFGLYSRKMNKYYIVSRDLILREMDPKEAVDYYQNFLGKSVELDPSEIGNALEPDAVPFIDLDQLEQRSLGNMNNMVLPNVIEPNRIPYINIVPQEETYGFDINTMVENIIL